MYTATRTTTTNKAYGTECASLDDARAWIEKYAHCKTFAGAFIRSETGEAVLRYDRNGDPCGEPFETMTDDLSRALILTSEATGYAVKHYLSNYSPKHTTATAGTLAEAIAIARKLCEDVRPYSEHHVLIDNLHQWHHRQYVFYIEAKALYRYNIDRHNIAERYTEPNGTQVTRCSEMENRAARQTLAAALEAALPAARLAAIIEAD